MTLISTKTPKEEMIKLAPACECEECKHGCTYGSGVLADEDIAPLAKFLKISEEELKQKHLEQVEKFNTTRYRSKINRKSFNGVQMPFGNCTFLKKDGKCAVHPAKPLECKISTGCQSHGKHASHWFALNYFVNKNDPESLRQWAHTLKAENNDTIVGGTMEELVPNKEAREKILNDKSDE